MQCSFFLKEESALLPCPIGFAAALKKRSLSKQSIFSTSLPIGFRAFANSFLPRYEENHRAPCSCVRTGLPEHQRFSNLFAAVGNRESTFRPMASR